MLASRSTSDKCENRSWLYFIFSMTTLQNPVTKETKIVETGFSISCCVLAPFWLAKRQLYVPAALSLALVLPTFGISSIVLGFIGNRLYINALKKKGWVPSEPASIPQTPHAKVQADPPASVQRAPQHEVHVPAHPSSPSSKNSQTDLQEGDSRSHQTELDKMISDVLGRHSGYEKAFTGQTVPASMKAKLSKSFPALNLVQETIKFAGLYSALGMKPVGIVITETTLHYRWSSGFFGFSKSGHVPFRSIFSLQAEHKHIHPCYGGGQPGPDITINSGTRGWIQTFMLMNEEDEKVLLEVLNELAALIPKLKH